MTVLFYGSVTEHTFGEKSFEAGSVRNLSDLAGKLCQHYGDKFKKFMFTDEECFFLVNGKSVNSFGGSEAPLHPDDKVELLPAIEAG